MKNKYFIFRVWHLDNVLTGNAVSVVQQSVNSVSNSTDTDWDTESKNINSSGADQMVLVVNKFISSISNQVSLVSQTEWNVQGNICTSSQTE